jgi:phospholipase/carboxylesterase
MERAAPQMTRDRRRWRTSSSRTTAFGLRSRSIANISDQFIFTSPVEAILLRAMPPLAHPQPVKLHGVPVLIVSGERDPIIQPESAAKLASLLERYGAAVEYRVFPAGHELSQADVTLARSWWNQQALAMTIN